MCAVRRAMAARGVNTTDSAVQVFPSSVRNGGAVSGGRSRKSRRTRLRHSRSTFRLLERKVAEENARYAAERKIAGGNRGAQRRAAPGFPQNRVTDHRIDLTLYNLSGVMDGDLDLIGLMADSIRRKLEELR